MARITVEDCLKHIPNRFELTVLAAKRARHLLMTAEEPMVPWGNDKATVVALREIAAGLVTSEFIALQEVSQAEDSEFLSPEEMLAQVAASMAELGNDLQEDDIEMNIEEVNLSIKEEGELDEIGDIEDAPAEGTDFEE